MPTKSLKFFRFEKKKCYFLCVNFLVTLFTPYCHSWHTQVCLQLFGPRSRFSTYTSKHKLPYRTFEPNFSFPRKQSWKRIFRLRYYTSDKEWIICFFSPYNTLKQPIQPNFRPTRCQFHQRFMYNFYAPRSQKPKKYS